MSAASSNILQHREHYQVYNAYVAHRSRAFLMPLLLPIHPPAAKVHHPAPTTSLYDAYTAYPAMRRNRILSSAPFPTMACTATYTTTLMTIRGTGSQLWFLPIAGRDEGGGRERPSASSSQITPADGFNAAEPIAIAHSRRIKVRTALIRFTTLVLKLGPSGAPP